MAVYIVGRGIGYHREGIDDIGDIYEIFDGPEPPGGPGYALSDIIKVSVLSREEVETVLDTMRPEIITDPENPEEKYWQNPEDSQWYEVKIHPKYDLNFADLNLEDRATLANEESTSVQQITALGKIVTNMMKYAENTQTPMPGNGNGPLSIKGK